MINLKLRLSIAVLVGLLASCSESTVEPPLAPSPLSTEKVNSLTIACPVEVQVQSLDGEPVVVSYPAITTQGGDPPVVVDCEPGSGTSFPVGRRAVNCRASDMIGQVVSCSFDTVVLSAPQLSVTKILAFGDSLTAGVVSQQYIDAIRLALETQNSYPIKLQARLAQAYRTQTISVVNEGLSGEKASEAASRLQSALSTHDPDVVLLMEGTNDLGTPGVSVSATVSSMETLVGLIESAGADAILATVPPIRPYGEGENAALVDPYNTNLRSLATRRGVSLVDVHTVVKNGNCSASSNVSTPCVGQDNIHLTREGYALVAEAFFDRIVTLYDSPVAAPTVGLSGRGSVSRMLRKD